MTDRAWLWLIAPALLFGSCGCTEPRTPVDCYDQVDKAAKERAKKDCVEGTTFENCETPIQKDAEAKRRLCK